MRGGGVWFRPRGRAALASVLADCRRESGLTQQALALRLGVNRTTLLDMEAGRNKSLTRWTDAMGALGYDVIVVPRGAQVTVEEATLPIGGTAEVRREGPDDGADRDDGDGTTR